jgi:hypothetical protein
MIDPRLHSTAQLIFDAVLAATFDPHQNKSISHPVYYMKDDRIVSESDRS